MTAPITLRTDTLETWRLNLNTISSGVGDPSSIYTTDGTDTFIAPATGITVAAINDLNNRKVKRSGDTIANLTVSTTLSVGTTSTFSGAATFSQGFSSTVAQGTAPFTVSSSTVVPNLNASLLAGRTWASPGAIGSTTPSTGNFTSLTVNGVAVATTASLTSYATIALTVPRTSTTGSAVIPAGTTAQRDASPANGYFRFNTDYQTGEIFNAAAGSWVGLGGASGAGGDAIFYLNGQTVNNSYTIPSGQNAMSAGPVTVATGVTVTVSSGSVWTIV